MPHVCIFFAFLHFFILRFWIFFWPPRDSNELDTGFRRFGCVELLAACTSGFRCPRCDLYPSPTKQSIRHEIGRSVAIADHQVPGTQASYWSLWNCSFTILGEISVFSIAPRKKNRHPIERLLVFFYTPEGKEYVRDTKIFTLHIAGFPQPNRLVTTLSSFRPSPLGVLRAVRPTRAPMAEGVSPPSFLCHHFLIWLCWYFNLACL